MESLRIGLTGLLLAGAVAGGEFPRTTAESSGYVHTTRYDDVMAFVAAIQKIDPTIRVETFATTNEGRPLPLVIAGPRGVVDPATARASRKPVVFIMANIHAGEVEGKEAALMVLRDLVTTSKKLRDDLVILIAPIYNADGNERISTENRKTQNGPPGGVGVRENAQGLDLNRDYMKLESPEARGLVSRILNRWDPLVTVDLHTTNGSYHGYQLTYSPMLNPNAAGPLIDFERKKLLPEIRARMRSEHGKETYYYGNFQNQLQPEEGWFTFESTPRFGNNYVGLRNRFTILSEAYSYIDFRARVEVTYQFIHQILRAVQRNGRAMRRLAERADQETERGRIDRAGVRFAMRPWQEVDILWERSLPAAEGEGSAEPWPGKGRVKRTGEIVPVRTTDYGVFASVEEEDMPFAYLLDAGATNAVENLMVHGVRVEKLASETRVDAAQFEVTRIERADQAFQKHKQTTVTGTWTLGRRSFPAGTFLVRTRQPLGRLVFYLLEPQTDDGFVNWNFFDEYLDRKMHAPVWKIAKPVRIRTAAVRVDTE